MIRRIATLIALALIPIAPAWALPDGSAQTPPYTVTGALFDQIVKTSGSVQANKNQGILGYNMTVHDSRYQYALPLCNEVSLVEQNGNAILPAGFVAGDTLVISTRANAAVSTKSCISRVVRQAISRGSSSGECLQNYQVKHGIEGEPQALKPKTEYTYVLSIYARPTLDCDAQAYGSSPITTVVAAGKPFTVWLERDTTSGVKELTRWSLTTDAAGKARFTYTFALPGDSYRFKIIPGGNAVAGDVIGWDAKVADPNPTASPVATPAATTPRLTYAPIIVILVLVLLGAIGAEYWHWVKKKRLNESPEQEYERTPKL